ncbi:MAG: alpha/beta fold hydrolase [Rhodobacteraceae bacterium]|nr:alpha/beta fold hydrolase [Paracoccaceae bacterium]
MTPVRRALLLSLLLLAACTPRAVLVGFPDGATPEVERQIFFATVRAPEGDGFGNDRSRGMHFGRYGISVPPDRAAGLITWPKGQTDPETQFLVTENIRHPSADAFRRDLAAELARRPAGRREAVIFVHGFNNTFAEGILRMAQLTHDLEVPGVAVHYSWPSAGSALGYEYDSDSQFFARDGLEALLEETRRAGAERIYLVAHSIGSFLAVETLRQIDLQSKGRAARLVDGVVLLSPDIDVELFRQQAQRISPLPQPFLIFVSRRDRALQLSALLTGQRNRLGNIDRVQQVADLSVTIVDVTEFSTGMGHFSVGNSPALLSILGNAGTVNAAFERDRAGRAGLLPGTVLTVQQATAIILSPVTALAP